MTRRYASRTRYNGIIKHIYVWCIIVPIIIIDEIASQESMCKWPNCHSKTWQELLQKITDIIFRQEEWRYLFSSATPHPLFFVILIIIHILIGINMKYDTFLSGTVSVAAQLDCGIIKKWREWLSFHVSYGYILN